MQDEKEKQYVAARNRAAFHSAGMKTFEIKGVDPNDAIEVQTKNGGMEVWANPQFKYYRDAYSKALTIPDGHAVDHVYPKKRAVQLKYGYVRLQAMRGPDNSAWGSFESKVMRLEEMQHVKLSKVLANLPDLLPADEWRRAKLEGKTPTHVFAEHLNRQKIKALALQSRCKETVGRLKRARGIPVAGARLRGGSRGTAYVGGLVTIAAAVPVLLELGYQAYDGVNRLLSEISDNASESGREFNLGFQQLSNLISEAESDGLLLVPVLKVRVPDPSLPTALAKANNEAKNIQEMNMRVGEIFDSCFEWQFDFIPEDDLDKQAEHMLTTKLAASQIKTVIWPECRKWLSDPGTDFATSAGFKAMLDSADSYWERIFTQAMQKHAELTRAALEYLK